MIKIDKRSLANLNRELKRLKSYSDSGFYNEIATIAGKSVARAQRRVPVQSGDLKRSIMVFGSGRKSVGVKAAMRYAPYVEFGTGRAVKLSDMQELGIPDSYASQFKGMGAKSINLGARPFFFNSVREEMAIGIERIKKKLK